MPLTSFRIENQKALKLAECSKVPPVMVIAGPNGVGKSTLLYQISRKQGTEQTDNARFLYQNPHRAARRVTVSRRFTMGSNASFRDVLAEPSMPGFEGMNFQYPSRNPDNVDEAGSTIKYSLGRIENRRQNAYARLVDQARENKRDVATGNLPDIYGPLKDLTKYLLPHLTFARIAFDDENDIKCLWTRTDQSATIDLDLDDLSSGEKSIVTLFLPLLEAEINRRLEEIINPGQVAPVEDIVMIIDEPEIHLHPDLQSKILLYLRSVARKDGVQFILSTHSPTLLDQTYDDELFLLSPPSGTPPTNQLRRVATNLERLEALKELTGNTFVVTTGRSIVCIEGTDGIVHQPADIQLLQVLFPRATAYTFIPSGGKSQVIATVSSLHSYLPEGQFGIKIFGLVDADQMTARAFPAGIVQLPVAMVENLLLSGVALHEYLSTRGLTALGDTAAVMAELHAIAVAETDNEIRLRVAKEIKPRMVRLSGADTDAIKKKHQEEIREVERMLPPDTSLAAITQTATESVAAIIAAGKELELFSGKRILNTFYLRQVQSANISYSKFCYEVAQVIAKGESLDPILNPVFDKLT